MILLIRTSITWYSLKQTILTKWLKEMSIYLSAEMQKNTIQLYNMPFDEILKMPTD